MHTLPTIWREDKSMVFRRSRIRFTCSRHLHMWHSWVCDQEHWIEPTTIKLKTKLHAQLELSNVLPITYMSFYKPQLYVKEIVNYGRFHNWCEWLSFFSWLTNLLRCRESAFLLLRNPRNWFTKWHTFAVSAQRASTPSEFQSIRHMD